MTTTTTTKSVLVIGATGQQGGAVVNHLLSGEYGEFDVRGLTRCPDSDAAQSLTERGVTVVEGDLLDRQSLQKAVNGVDAVYAMTDYFAAGGYEADVEHGTNIAEIAAEADVDHYVFSSVEGADRETGIPFFDSKYEVEQHLNGLDLPLTIIRPTNFMQNLEAQREEIRAGTLATPIEEGVTLQMVDVDDIGALAATVFADLDRYVGETLPLASDEAKPAGMAAQFGEILSTNMGVQHVPIEGVRAEMGEGYAAMYEWLNDAGHEVDIGALRAETGLEVTPFEEYLRTNWS
jgi:uncharacterized protein YbjT (DUF2867 family)